MAVEPRPQDENEGMAGVVQMIASKGCFLVVSFAERNWHKSKSEAVQRTRES